MAIIRSTALFAAVGLVLASAAASAASCGEEIARTAARLGVEVPPADLGERGGAVPVPPSGASRPDTPVTSESRGTTGGPDTQQQPPGADRPVATERSGSSEPGAAARPEQTGPIPPDAALPRSGTAPTEAAPAISPGLRTRIATSLSAANAAEARGASDECWRRVREAQTQADQEGR